MINKLLREVGSVLKARRVLRNHFSPQRDGRCYHLRTEVSRRKKSIKTLEYYVLKFLQLNSIEMTKSAVRKPKSSLSIALSTLRSQLKEVKPNLSSVSGKRKRRTRRRRLNMQAQKSTNTSEVNLWAMKTYRKLQNARNGADSEEKMRRKNLDMLRGADGKTGKGDCEGDGTESKKRQVKILEAITRGK